MPVVLMPPKRLVCFAFRNKRRCVTVYQSPNTTRVMIQLEGALKNVFCQLSWRWRRHLSNLIHLVDDYDLTQLHADSEYMLLYVWHVFLAIWFVSL